MPRYVRRDRRTDVQGDSAEAALQFAYVEATPISCIPKRTCEVEQRAAPLRVPIHERGMLWVEGSAVIIDLLCHGPIVGLAFPVMRRCEQPHTRGMAGDDGLR